MKQLFFLILSLLASLPIVAQVAVDTLAVAIHVQDTTLSVSWLPASPATYAAVREQGFRMERYALPLESVDGKNIDPAFWQTLTEGLQPTILPGENAAFRMADSMALNAAAEATEGFTRALTYFLYSEAYNNAGDAEDRLRMQYEMSAFAALQLQGESAALLGLQYSEPRPDTNSVYLYRITAVGDPSVRQEVLVGGNGLQVVRYPITLPIDFSSNPFRDLLPPEPTRYEMTARYKAYGDSVTLRWAPLSPELLRNSIKAGYVLQRGDYNTGNNLGNPTVTFGDSIRVMPWAPEQFEAYFNAPGEKDSAVLIVAQALYGELQANDEIERQDALTNLFVFALQAADQSPLAATALGVRYVDRAVAPGKTYDYLISMVLDSIDATAMPLAEYLVIENEYTTPPDLIGLTTIEGEFTISLLLDPQNASTYDRYEYDRSDDDGFTWVSLTGGPVRFEADASLNTDNVQLLFEDQVPELYRPYRYRVRGANGLGEESPWAEITAISRDRTGPAFPVLDTVYATSATAARLEWNGTKSEASADFVGYVVQVGDNTYQESMRDVSPVLSAGTTSFDWENPAGPFSADSSYFFTVYALDTARNRSGFIPLSLNVIDSIAPAPPVGLTGSIDTNGIATILWQPSPESDVAGYQVYFANDTSEVFSQITREDLDYNLFRDTLVLNTLNDAIFYRVTAYDRSYNTSEFSGILRVERPDVVAPTPPVLLLPNPTGQAVELHWKPSSSDDAVIYRILRRPDAAADTPWRIIDSVAATELFFADTTAAYETAYQYMVLTVDDADLVSEDGNVQTGRRIFTADVGGVGEVSVSLVEPSEEGQGARTQVQWQYEKPAIPLLREADHRFMLFRAEGAEPLTRYKQLKSKIPTYTDKNVEAGKTYRYALMVVYDNGKKSSLTDGSAVTIPEAED